MAENANTEATPQKPWVTESMLLSFVTEVDSTHVCHVPKLSDDSVFSTSEYYLSETNEVIINHVLPLRDFTIEEKEAFDVITIHDLPKPVLQKIRQSSGYLRGALSVTDDPMVEWAGDWSDLGCFRLVYKFWKPIISVVDTKLTLTIPFLDEGTRGKQRDITIPDKERWF